MHRLFLGLGFLLAGLGVAAGAVLTHTLEGRLPADRLDIFETAARYHLIHALGLILIGFAAARWTTRAWSGPGLSMIFGVTVFSGSLYILAFTGVGWLGAVTPIGGLFLILAWLWAAWIAFTRT